MNLTHFTLGGQYELEKVYQMLVMTNQLMFEYFQMVSLVLNMCLCDDLIQTLKNPFEVGRSRVWKYITVSALVPLMVVSTIWMTTH